MSEAASNLPTNRHWVLKRYAQGAPKDSDFALIEAPARAPGPGEVLLETLYVSLDPYMRGRISGRRGYADPQGIDAPMQGGSVGRVLASRDGNFPEGAYVAAFTGWQSHPTTPTLGMRRLDPSQAPISTALGVLGMPGHTAYAGLLVEGKPKPGETVFVSAATGAVGAVVGQIAKIKGCRAIGLAGGPEKCRYAVEELGFDACIDHKAENLDEALRRVAPDGIDINFENVGGEIFTTVMRHLRLHGRMVICGAISQYNATELAAGPPDLLVNAIVKRFTLRGILVSDYMHLFPEFLSEVSGWIREGRLKYREDIVEGIDGAVAAFQGLLQGKNFGKLLVRVAPDPTR